MITDACLKLVSYVITAFDALLPTLSFPTWLTTNASSAITSTVGDFLAPERSFLPVDAILTVLQGIVAFLPVAVAYLAFQWAWNHVPTIAGFGTH